MVRYYFDSYAIIEFINGNKDYESYIYAGVVMTHLNLVECYSSWVQEMGEELAEHYFRFFKPFCISILDEDIKNGVKFRIYLKSKNKRYKPSFTDCIGYVIALRLGIKFLTGDNAFQGLENVEFVK